MGHKGAQDLARNHQWKGGRTVASNGYVLIKVGKGHHLADVRGYAYEHRLVAEEKLARRLEPGEVVHHRDENKQNNNAENLEVLSSLSTHRHEHRTKPSRAPGETNPLVRCACGCLAEFQKYDRGGRPRRYVSGHNSSGGAK